LIETLLTHSPWLSIAIWAFTYLLDYYLTLYAARLYQAGAKEHFGFGGSYELTPYYQKEIDHLRLVSPRFLLMLALSSLAIWLVWWLAVRVLGLSELFSLLIGGLVSRQLILLARHVRNIVLFRQARTPGNIQGRVDYLRHVTLHVSAAELFTFAVIYLLISLISGSVFFVGGALACTVTGVQHWIMAGKASPKDKDS
jgi:hypothetical protein